MIKLPPLDLYAGNTADRNSTNFPKRANGLGYVDVEAGALYVHASGSWHGLGVPGIPEPPDDAETYGRKTDTTSSWVAVVPKAGGQFTGNVGINMTPTVELQVDGKMRVGVESTGRFVEYYADGSGTNMISWNGAAFGAMRVYGSSFSLSAGTVASPQALITGSKTGAGELNFFGGSPVARQTGVTASTALENLGLGTSLTDEMPISGGTFTGAVTVNGAFIVNDTAADVDMRVEGTSDANLLYVDAGNNRVGIGTNSPAAWLDLSKSNATTSPITGLRVNNVFAPSSAPGSVFPSSFVVISDYDSTHSPSGGFQLAQFLNVRNVGNGTISTRCLDVAYSNLGNGTVVFSTGLNVRTPVNSGGGAITTAYGIKVENQNVAGTNYAIYTDAGIVRIGDGITVGSPTGGYKGSGTINAQAIYDDNVIVSDHIFDLHYDGRVKPADAERFPKARLWNIEQTAVFTEKNRHLPTMPGRLQWETAGGNSLGRLVTALWETVEQQQLQIFNLNSRLKAVTNGKSN